MIETGLLNIGTALGSDIANHLWQSTLFAAAGWLLTLLLRKNHARVRYWIWTAVSVKFLVPFSLLVSLGGAISPGWTSAAGTDTTEPAMEWILVQNINQPFSPSENMESSVAVDRTPASFTGYLSIICVFVWICGSIAILLYWLILNRRALRIIRQSDYITGGQAVASLLRLNQHIKIPSFLRIAFSKTSQEPGVYGIFRPVLILPPGIPELLKRSELESILQHELSHIRNRDNLVAAIHMLVKTLFWFHPLVWWVGSRLIHERERACDEAVLQSGNEPQSYAEGILKVCEFYLESPLPCVSGVIGSDLKKRIERIMTKHMGNRLSVTRKLFLTAMAFIALTIPLLIGAMSASSGRAQTKEGLKPSFDVISIKPAESCAEVTEEAPGRFRVIALSPRFQPGRFSGCSSLKGLIAMAYQVDADDIAEGPGWIESSNYRIEAKAEGETDTEILRLMLQSLLQERFGLEFHTETREKPVYALVVAEGGHKLKQALDENGNPIVSLPSMESERAMIEETIRKGEEPPLGGTGIRVKMTGSPDGGLMGEFTVDAIDMERFAAQLKGMVGRTVVDRTGLTGVYGIKIQSAVDRQLMGTRLPIMLPPGAAPLPGTALPPGIAPQSGAKGPAPSAEPLGPTVFTALIDQLGLKLESDEAPLDQLVIDKVEKPSEN